jgi:multimeric flavodoxin WrbA
MQNMGDERPGGGFMKTLILNGSTRRHGDTAALIEAFRGALAGEVLELSFFDGISPCVDCRDCWAKPGCSLDDGLRPLYPFFEACDNLVLASPVWFSELSGPLLNLCSRLVQPYFAARRFRNETPTVRKKNGVLILTAGGEKNTEEKAAATAHTLFKSMNALPTVAFVSSLDTDNLPASQDEKALHQAREAAQLLNRLCQE